MGSTMTLSFITLTNRLRSDAAASYKRMRAQGLPAGITSAYRSAEAQQVLRNKYIAYLNGGPYANFALPPSQSNHVKGIAIDVPMGSEGWLKEHGAHNGWTEDANEHWHFNYNPNHDQVAIALAKAAEERRVAQVKVARIKKVLGLRGWYTSNRTNRETAQTLLGVPVDGVYGPKTQAAWAALEKAAK